MGGAFTPANWQGRIIRAIAHEYDFYVAASRTLIGLDGYGVTPEPSRLRINGTVYPLSAGSVSWATYVTGITFSPSPTNTINWTSHGLAVGDPVQFYCSGGMPSGLTAFTIYYVQSVVRASAFKIAATPGGAALSFTGSGSGTRYGYKDPITAYQANGTLSGNVYTSVLPPSSNSVKESNERPSNIGACNTAGAPPKINPQTRPALRYFTPRSEPNVLTLDNLIFQELPGETSEPRAPTALYRSYPGNNAGVRAPGLPCARAAACQSRH